MLEVSFHEPKGRASSPLRADACNHPFLQGKERRARSESVSKLILEPSNLPDRFIKTRQLKKLIVNGF